ncbi:unnamed protein product [Acanthosepion pharaonis]|uniref:Vezatin n=1 Tax=Acanthosepion pharaonis TaxID=158019 RepID=A0A812B9K7_ACAPH|nr:unnamed protein product [Sepia pharaonis]
MKHDNSSHNGKKTVNDFSKDKDMIRNIRQFLEAIYHKLKIHLSLDLLFTKLHSHQNHLLLQKIIQSKALEDDDKIFLENYISETRESADLNKGKEAFLCCVYPLFAIILLYMWCLFSPLSAMVLMNPTFSLMQFMTKCYFLMLIGLVAVIIWHVLLFKHKAWQVIDFLQLAETSITLQKKSLRLIQEVELVRKGFTLVSSQISISKAENSLPVSHRLCPELRRLLFLASRSNMLSSRKSTSLLLEYYPLIDEVDKASTYLANIPLQDYGPSLQEVEDDDESKEKLSQLTDDFSVTALKAMLYLYSMQQSEFVRRLALCFCVNAQPEAQRGKVDSSLCQLIVNLNKRLLLESMKLGNSYEFHRSSFQERDAKSSPVNQKQAMSSVSELYMAIHSLDLHLRAALHRSFALSTELEKFSEDETQQNLEMIAEGENMDEKIQDNLSKKENLWYEQLESVKAELEACRGCWEVVSSLFMPLQVFEDYTDPDKDEFECDYVHLSPEEREKRQQDREESRRMMFELRNVIAVRATDMERREEIAVKRNQMQKDDTICASTHSSSDAEQSDDSLHTDSLQSDSLQSDLPNKDVDPMQQSGNLNEDLIDEDLLVSDDEFSTSKLKEFSNAEDTSVNKISWSKSLSLNPEGEQQETTPFFLHQSVDRVESDRLSDLHLRNLLFSPASDTTDTESMKTDSLQEKSKSDQTNSISESDKSLASLNNSSTDQENNSSHPLSKQNEFKLSNDSSQIPSDQSFSFSFILHPEKENSSRTNSRSPSLTPTHRANSNHINNNASISTSLPNTDSTSSTQSSGFFLHTTNNDDDSNSSPLPKRSLQGTNLMDLQERWAANSGSPGLSLTRNIAAMASARCKEQLNLNIQTFGDEEETFGDDSFDEDDAKGSADDEKELSEADVQNKVEKN